MPWFSDQEALSAMCSDVLARELSFLAAGGLLLLASLALSRTLFRRLWIRDSTPRTVAARCLASFQTLVLSVLLLDATLYTVSVPSGGDAHSLVARRWFCVHWSPLSSLGYRDEEPGRLLHKLHTVFVVGDSFVAGHGVPAIRDRFSNVLERQLGEAWAVANVARPGWDTPRELQAYEELAAMVGAPDVVVWSWVPNDVFPIAERRGLLRHRVVRGAPWWHGVIRDNSYLWSLLLTCWQQLVRPGGRFEARPSLSAIHGDGEVWREHSRDLLRMATRVQQGSVPLLIVIAWPLTWGAEDSRQMIAGVSEVLGRQGIPVLDLSELLRESRLSDYVASPIDSHPNRAIHRRVGELLAAEIERRLGILGPGPPARPREDLAAPSHD